RFDLVSFDPRGVGASTAVDCVDDLDDQVLVLADPADDAAWKAIVDDQVETVAACKQRSGELLVQVGTMNAARDMDLLRDALGDERLTYVGFSYGTRLGAAYAELFPQRTRALVLDGAVKPDPRLNALNEAQTRGFEQAFANFARACDADADCPLAELGGADAAFRSVRQLIADGGPLKTADGRRLTEGEFYLGVLTALYVQEAWSALAYGLYVADTSANGWVLEQLSDLLVGRQDDGTYDNSNEANVAINCADDAERPSEAALRAESAALFTPGNHFGPLMGSDAGCLGWPAAIDSLQLGPATGAPPLLVIGTTGDPATPYEWAVELADFLDSGVLFTYEGEGHTAFLSGDCVEDVVVDYLVELALPAAPARCSDPERSADLFPKLR
ncbi:MAG: alpha/beta hydrolase, partial [Acidimicrobiia bacterium]|nr:alpha/beta hydrolase [Acidimicrobiia bacterium]